MKKYLKDKEILYYLIVIATAFLIYKLINQNIEIVLKPYVLVLKLLYKLKFEFLPDLGYREISGLFIIGRDCIGSKLFICLFLIMNICCLSYYKGFKKICMILSFCISSILLTFGITIFRITASIPFCGMASFKLIHTILSLIIYFGSSIILYTFLKHKYRGEN